jgi:hypothetical protein
MFGIEEHPVEASGGQRPNRISRAELETTAAELNPAVPKCLFYRILPHDKNHTLAR